MQLNLKIKIPLNTCFCEEDCLCKEYIKCKNNCFCGNDFFKTQEKSIHGPNTPDYKLIKNKNGMKKSVSFGDVSIEFLCPLMIKSKLYFWTIERNKKLKNNFLSPQAYNQNKLNL